MRVRGYSHSTIDFFQACGVMFAMMTFELRTAQAGGVMGWVVERDGINCLSKLPPSWGL